MANQAFISSALGKAYEYRAKFGDKVGIVMLAKTGHSGGDLHAREVGTTSAEYNLIYHTQDQVKQVLLDMDAADL